MNALNELLNNLEAIGATYPELYDTDVKEQTGSALIEILFYRNPQYQIPNSFGMFSEEANKEIQTAFQEFANQCKELELDFDDKLGLLGPKGAVTTTGQIAECFFGEITKNVIYPKPIVLKRHWLDTPVVFGMFLGMPAILILILLSLIIPEYLNNKTIFVIALIISAVVSVVVGHSLWQYCANRIFRKRDYDQQA